MKKIFKMERTIAKYARPVAKRIYDVPIPDDEYFQAIAYLFERMRGVDQILSDPKVTSVRLITNPEKIVLKETQRVFMYFSLYKMNIDAIIMNRVLPDDLKDTYFTDWIKSQQKHIKKAKAYFNPIPIFPVNLSNNEIIGYKNLKALAYQIYGEKNPLERFYKEEPYALIKDNKRYRLTIKLPFIMKDDVELNKLSDELIVRISSFKRHILLPRQVASLDSVRAKVEGEYLHVYFKGDGHGQEKKEG